MKEYLGELYQMSPNSQGYTGKVFKIIEADSTYSSLTRPQTH